MAKMYGKKMMLKINDVSEFIPVSKSYLSNFEMFIRTEE